MRAHRFRALGHGIRCSSFDPCFALNVTFAAPRPNWKVTRPLDCFLTNETAELDCAMSEMDKGKTSIPDSDSVLLASIIQFPISVMALISLSQRVFSVKLYTKLADFVQFWRHLIKPTAVIIDHVIPITVPQWYPDLLIISFMVSIMVTQALPDTFNPDDGPIKRALMQFTALLLLALSLYGFAMLSVIIIFAFGENETRSTSRPVVLGLFAVLTATIIFFAINAQLIR